MLGGFNTFAGGRSNKKLCNAVKYINIPFVCWRGDLGGRRWVGAPNCALHCMLIYLTALHNFLFELLYSFFGGEKY